MRIYDFIDYKKYVNARLEMMPKQGRGEYARIAIAANANKATISQIFKGEKHLSPEQAIRVAQHFTLSPKETSFFLLLVNYQKAGSADLQQHLKNEIDHAIEINRELSERLPKTRELSPEERAVFYSSWMYSAVRVLSSIPPFHTKAEIAKRLRLPHPLLDQILETLLQTGLCVEKDGKILPGPQSTFLPAKSPLVSRHHGNWRIKAMERHPQLKGNEELAYTSPLSLSSADVLKIREILAKTIERVDEIVAPSDCERIFCLNVDWFEVW